MPIAAQETTARSWWGRPDRAHPGRSGEFIHVHGDLDARCLASLQNFVQVDGETRCDCRIDSAQSEDLIKRMFAPGLLKAFEGMDNDGQRIVGWYPDDDAYLACLRQGRSPLRRGD